MKETISRTNVAHSCIKPGPTGPNTNAIPTELAKC